MNKLLKCLLIFSLLLVSIKGSAQFARFSVASDFENVTHKISQFAELEYQVQKHYSTDFKNQFIIRIFFPKLNRLQFEALKFRFWKNSELEFEERPYYLSEFLPPAFQAVNQNHNLDVKIDEHSDINFRKIGWNPFKENYPEMFRQQKFSNKNDFYDADTYMINPYMRVRSNCWTTAYELLRQDENSFNFFFASDNEITKFLGKEQPENEYSFLVKKLNWQQACTPDANGITCQNDLSSERNSKLEFGDLLMIFNQADQLVHAAIYIVDDVYFEKAGAKSGQPFRLNTWNEIRKSYRNENKIIFRRFNQRGFKKLPAPVSAFGQSHPIEKNLNELIKTDLNDHFKIIYYPETMTSRDISVFPFRCFALEKSGKSTGSQFELEPAAYSTETFLAK